MKDICLFVFLFNSLFFNCMHAIINKTIKNDHPIALYQIIRKLSNKIPSCALLIWMNTDYWVCNFVYEIIINKQRKNSRQENQNVESWLVFFKLYSFFKRLEGYFFKKYIYLFYLNNNIVTKLKASASLDRAKSYFD